MRVSWILLYTGLPDWGNFHLEHMVLAAKWAPVWPLHPLLLEPLSSKVQTVLVGSNIPSKAWSTLTWVPRVLRAGWAISHCDPLLTCFEASGWVEFWGQQL